MKARFLCGVILVSIFAVGALWAEENQEQVVVTIKGYVEVDQAEDDGTIQSIGLWNDDDAEFLSVVPGQGKDTELRKELGKLVQVKGHVTVNAGGLKSITVLEFEVLPDESIPAEKDDEEDRLDD